MKPLPPGKYTITGHSLEPLIAEFGHSVPIHYTQAEWRKYCQMRDACQRERHRRYEECTRRFYIGWHPIYDANFYEFYEKGWDLL